MPFRVPSHREVHQRRHLFALGDVDLERVGADARRRDLGGDRPRACLVEVRDDEISALADQGPRRLFADAAGATRDDDDVSLELHESLLAGYCAAQDEVT